MKQPLWLSLVLLLPGCAGAPGGDSHVAQRDNPTDGGLAVAPEAAAAAAPSDD